MAQYRQPPPFVHLTPSDNLNRLPRCLWTDPAEFQPQHADEEMSPPRDFVEWGVTPLTNQTMEDLVARMMSMNGKPQGSSGHGIFDPEKEERRRPSQRATRWCTQYRRLLAARKAEAIETRRRELPEYEDLMKSGFIIKVTLLGIPGDRSASKEDKAAFDPSKGQQVWRRLRVCGATTLHALHDRILQPSLGWCRRYHSYFFTDARDGAQFGPEDSGCIDEMHRAMGGEVFLDDARYVLADVVGQVGDRMRMMYDLGDHFEVALEIESIVPDCPRFALLGGQGAWAPEDSNGCPEKGNRGYLMLLRKVRRDGENKHTEFLREAASHSGCFPYQIDSRGRLRLFHFDVEEHEAQVLRALADPYGKEPMGAKTLVTRMDPVRGVVQEWQEGGGLGFGRRANPARMAELLKRTALCGGCGSPHGLKLCSKCKSAKFCSRECQEQGWGLHKKDCKALSGAR